MGEENQPVAVTKIASERRRPNAHLYPDHRNRLRRRDDSVALGITFAFISTVCFALQGIVVKLAYAEHVSVIAVLFWRKVVYLPFFWIFALITVERDKILIRKSDIIFCLVAGAIGYFLVPRMSITALTLIDVGIERVIMFSFPIMVILINAIIERQFPSKKNILIFLMTEVGTFLLIGGMEKDILSQNLKGAEIVFAAAIIQAIFVIMTQSLMRRIGTVSFMLWAQTGASIAVIADLGINWVPSNLLVNPRGFILIAMVAALSFPTAFMFTEGVRRIGGSRVSLISSNAPMLTVIFSYLILGEILLPDQLLGAAIVVIAMIIMNGKTLMQILTPGKQVKVTRRSLRPSAIGD